MNGVVGVALRGRRSRFATARAALGSPRADCPALPVSSPRRQSRKGGLPRESGQRRWASVEDLGRAGSGSEGTDGSVRRAVANS